MKIIIDGITIPKEEITGLKGSVIDIQSVDEETGQIITKSISQEFTFTGAAYDQIAAVLITPANGSQNFLPVKIFEDSCCSTDVLLFEGIIDSTSVSWCYEECEVTVQFVEHTDETKAMDCVRSTLVDDNWNGFKEASHPRIVYCNEIRPEFLAHVVLVLGMQATIILAILTPIVAVVSAIVEAINQVIDTVNNLAGTNIAGVGGFDNDESTSLFNEWNQLMSEISERLIGCGRKHPSPLVRSYILNVCDKCGLQFSSTIYNNTSSDYYNAVYLSAPIEKGTRNENDTYIDENHPIKTLDLFLDDLKLVHNALWKIKNGILYFERHDYFNNGNIWLNFETENSLGNIQGKLCMEWRTETKPSYINLEYSMDSVDATGTEAMNVYNNIVEWNQPVSELQSGHRDVLLPFGTPRFRDDGIDQDILGNYSWFTIAGFGFGDEIDAHQGVLILEKGIAFQPKLLIWDGVDINFARIKTYTLYNQLIDPPPLMEFVNKNYNAPYMFYSNNAAANTAYPSNYEDGSLYSRFYALDNPKIYTDSGKSFTFTVRYNCQTLQNAVTAEYVQLPYGVGRISRMQINLDTKEILVSGDV